jgi:hypothetical protein
MAIKNNIINSIEDIKVLDDERILLYSSQLTIFEIDINEGVILRHYILPSENPYHICDYMPKIICEKTSNSDTVRIQWM